ncbi:lactase/phlorizin hydrolase isoform X1 [Petromyzon marinus]|uniref:lactase/phlorizin hydrolase isoform X1 n=1 Tax=Petromyzon marinus TaxID=7757 RepID=UPI003F6EC35E
MATRASARVLLLACVMSAFSTASSSSSSSKSPSGVAPDPNGDGPPESKDPREGSPRAGLYEPLWRRFHAELPAQRDAPITGTFPAGFAWGAATASYQVEGAWDADGKGESIWDRFSHDGFVHNNESGDVACDSYHKAPYDAYLARGLGLGAYRFSISWSRLFPRGGSGRWDEASSAGVRYYSELIGALLDSGVEPVVTLFHWDLPQALEELGGWRNESLMVEEFAGYASFCFREFGSRVRRWITFNEPWVVAWLGHGNGYHAPGLSAQPGRAPYVVAHTMIKAHARAWHDYDKNYRASQGGQVGITLNSDWVEPGDPELPADVEAAERYLEFLLGWFAEPIFGSGDYPEVMKKAVEKKDIECGREGPSRLPAFTAEEKAYIKGTSDFFGLNHYTTRLVRNADKPCEENYENDGSYELLTDPAWLQSAAPWLYAVPWGFRRLLAYISARVGPTVPIIVTENGWATDYAADMVNDTDRVDYYRTYINEALKAVKLDGVTLSGYTAWSLMDNFEWREGYSQRFGLHHVDFEDPDRPRTPKESALFYAAVIRDNGFPAEGERTRGRTGTGSRPLSAPSGLDRSRPPMPASRVPSKASEDIWSRFSGQTVAERDEFVYGVFPSEFTWSAATSSYQVEGAWDADGKGPSIWDDFAHRPGNIDNGDTGDVACDSYHKIAADVYMLRALRVTHYRFSVSWPRVFPTGRLGSLNPAGVRYYDELIDALLDAGISPVVTLYHWDLPQALQDIGGWQNESLVELFHDYADFCFAQWGDRVKFWITFNEPYVVSWLGYGVGAFAPGIWDPGYAPYRVAHTIIKAHARAYRNYESRYRREQRGVVSITLSTEWAEPKNPADLRDVAAADRFLQSIVGWFAHPIFKNGDYPDALKWQVGNKSALLGLNESRLPSFTDDERRLIQGSADVFCINGYTTRLVSHAMRPFDPPSYEHDRDSLEETDPSWPSSAAEWLRPVAWGMRRLLGWVAAEYGPLPVYITENGVASEYLSGKDDPDRIQFYETYINEALKASTVDGVDLRGYTAWSLMDNFEWASGYSMRFGMHHVDFSHPSRPRTPKRSAHVYAAILNANGFPMPERDRPFYGYFPQGFAWSSATSSYQIEGAWQSDGKGLSIWDEFAHSPGRVAGGDTGDEACDSYRLWPQDVEALRALGVSHYRFSLSWPRLLPDGTDSYVNPAAVQYYSDLIDGLLSAGIKPQVTLYHWDLPSALQAMGGWRDERLVELFANYARKCFQLFGSRVQFWITFNEPWIVALLGHGYGSHPPGVADSGRGQYRAGHTLLLAHAAAWHVYDREFRSRQGGLISITLNSDWAEPRNPNSHADVKAANTYLQFFLGWFAHPIFKTGDYPDAMKWAIGNRSMQQGHPESRLPRFTDEQKALLRGTHDFFGLNHYTSVLAFPRAYADSEESYDADRGVGVESHRAWPVSGSGWLRVVPWGLRRLLAFIGSEYGHPPVYITENGVSERGSLDLNDTWRIRYYRTYINEVLKAVTLDRVNVRGYTAWSLMDNFEWTEGYQERFGLYHVDTTVPERTRVPKASAAFLRSLISCNGFPDPDQPLPPCALPQATTTGRPRSSPKPGATDPVPTLESIPQPGRVLFMGAEMSADDAAAALYSLFAVALAGALACGVLLWRLCSLRRGGGGSKAKKQEGGGSTLM